jgi:hypothetical protein
LASGEIVNGRPEIKGANYAMGGEKAGEIKAGEEQTGKEDFEMLDAD